MAGSVVTFFAELPDPRSPLGRRHLLGDVVTIAVCGVICGAESWTEVEQFGRDKLAWFRTFLALPHGIASHDTFGRIFARLDPEAFERCFVAWMESLADRSGRRIVAVDGKTLRRSFDHASDQAAIHMVSAFASVNRLVLGQIATEAKSNEITAIPKLLELLDLREAVITIDAMGCQKEIARTILKQGGDYVLAVKGNQPTLYEQVRGLMDEGVRESFQWMRHDGCIETDGGHGRIETRRVWTTPDVQWLKGMED
jgi:predicted transposase YbfD/YdcC